MNGLKSLLRGATLPVEIASLVFFRIAFGSLMAMWAWDYLASGRVTALYVQPGFHFSYTLTPWVKAWPGSGMHWHFLLLLVTALMIAAGCCYRFATLIFALAFSYFFLIDRANYQNHYYLTVILAWSLTILPLHRGFSLDVWRRPNIRQETVDAWCLWLTRFHIGLPYAFGGIAKLTADWLLGEPMNSMLLAEGDLPIIGPWLALPGMGLLFSYGGLLLDLAIVPLLLYKPTRLAAYVACVLFHLTNASLFDIHVFPWMMIAATTVFFEPDWPKRLFAKLNGLAPAHRSPADFGVVSDAVETPPLSPGRRLLFAVLLLHVVLQLLLPLRHRFYEGDPSWTERGHLFAWRMMLRGKTGGVRFYVTDRKAGRTSLVGFEGLLSEQQFGRFSRDPRMVLQLAHHIGKLERELNGREVEVRALVLLSLNGRKPEPLIDPNRDLMRVADAGFHLQRGCPDWILPRTEPLRSEPWREPLAAWEQLVELPELEFLASAPLAKSAGAGAPSRP